MLTIPKFTFPSKNTLPEFYQGKRSELLDRRNDALSVLKDSKGKTAASRVERHSARMELASVYDQADIEGLFIGQEEPCASARKDMDAMNEADLAFSIKFKSRRAPNLQDLTKVIAARGSDE